MSALVADKASSATAVTDEDDVDDDGDDDDEPSTHLIQNWPFLACQIPK